MTLVRFTWLLSLALAVLITVGGQVKAQVKAIDQSDGGESEAMISPLEHGLVADCDRQFPQPPPAVTGPLTLEVAPPRDRLVVSELFRPPRRASRS